MDMKQIKCAELLDLRVGWNDEHENLIIALKLNKQNMHLVLTGLDADTTHEVTKVLTYLLMAASPGDKQSEYRDRISSIIMQNFTPDEIFGEILSDEHLH